MTPLGLQEWTMIQTKNSNDDSDDDYEDEEKEIRPLMKLTVKIL